MGGKDDYDSENSWISDGFPSSNCQSELSNVEKFVAKFVEKVCGTPLHGMHGAFFLLSVGENTLTSKGNQCFFSVLLLSASCAAWYLQRVGTALFEKRQG